MFLYQVRLKVSKGQSLEEIAEGLDKLLSDFDRSYHEPDREHVDNNLDGKAKFYAKQLIGGCLTHWKTLEEQIKATLVNWKLEKLEPIDLTILMLSGYELLFEKDTPTKVVINEAVNMAKKFSSGESYSFINGILDKLAKKA